MDAASKQYEWLKPFQYQKGHSGNPKGKEPGTISIKQRVRQFLQDHPDEAEQFVADVVRKQRTFTWQMLEGSPQSKTDITSGGNPLAVTVLSFDDYNSPQPKAE